MLALYMFDCMASFNKKTRDCQERRKFRRETCPAAYLHLLLIYICCLSASIAYLHLLFTSTAYLHLLLIDPHLRGFQTYISVKTR